jgi:hypothetical protein
LTGLVTGGISSGLEAAWNEITGKTSPPPLFVSSEILYSRRSAFVFSRPLGESRLPPLEARVDWARRNGGIDAVMTAVRIIIEGRGARAVTLRSLDIAVLKRRPPPTGMYIAAEGAGGISVRHFIVELDRRPPSVHARPPDAPVRGEPNEAIDFPYRVSSSDPEVFHLYAVTESCDCLWEARLRWTAAGEAGTTTIRNGERPFRTAAIKRARERYVPRYGEWIQPDG